MEDVREKPEGNDVGVTWKPVDENEEAHRAMPEISFHTIAGADHPQTLRVVGTLRNRPLILLIDSGSSHNFIDNDVISQFGLPVENSSWLQVMEANKDPIDCVGQCKALTLNI